MTNYIAHTLIQKPEGLFVMKEPKPEDKPTTYIIGFYPSVHEHVQKFDSEKCPEDKLIELTKENFKIFYNVDFPHPSVEWDNFIMAYNALIFRSTEDKSVEESQSELYSELFSIIYTEIGFPNYIRNTPAQKIIQEKFTIIRKTK